MTRFNSVSDLARSYQLRLSQGSLKAKLDTLGQEAASGTKADIPLALGGDLMRINQVDARLTMLATYRNNLSEAELLFTGMQDVVQNIRTMANTTGTALVSDTLTSADNVLQIHLEKAPDELRSMLSSLKLSVAGRSAFAGSRVDQAAVVGYDGLLAQLGAAVGGSTDAQAIIAAIDGYFDAPAGAGGFADTGYLGSDTGTSAIPVAANKALSSGLTANSTEFRQALKGFAIMAFAAATPTLDSAAVRTLGWAAGNHLLAAKEPLAKAMTRIGLQQEAAATTRTAHEAETSALTQARNGMIAADPYETATALKEIEANIETLYTLTARLSKLSLTDYL